MLRTPTIQPPSARKRCTQTILRNIYANKAEAEKLLRASDLDYTIVYPTALTNGPATDTYRVGENISMNSAVLKVNRADNGPFYATVPPAMLSGLAAMLLLPAATATNSPLRGAAGETTMRA